MGTYATGQIPHYADFFPSKLFRFYVRHKYCNYKLSGIVHHLLALQIGIFKVSPEHLDKIPWYPYSMVTGNQKRTSGLNCILQCIFLHLCKKNVLYTLYLEKRVWGRENNSRIKNNEHNEGGRERERQRRDRDRQTERQTDREIDRERERERQRERQRE